MVKLEISDDLSDQTSAPRAKNVTVSFLSLSELLKRALFDMFLGPRRYGNYGRQNEFEK